MKLYHYDNEWKSLVNAIIHDGFDPSASVTIIACEKCQNPYLHMMLSNEFPLIKNEYSRISITLYFCPNCGHVELDCMGTYGLPNALPGDVLPFVGHFFELWFCLLNKAHELEPEIIKEEDLSRK